MDIFDEYFNFWKKYKNIKNNYLRAVVKYHTLKYCYNIYYVHICIYIKHI
jgi:hypothetical protein